MYGSDCPCPLCSAQARLAPLRGDFMDIVCERCGCFQITGTAEECVKNSPDLRRRLSGWVRDQLRAGVDLPRIESYTDPPDPTLSQRIEKLLLEATQGLDRPDQTISLGEPRFIAASYSRDHDEVIYLWPALTKRGWATRVFDQGPQIRITAEGHEIASQLRQRSENGQEKGMGRIGF
jgi:hypothetical protein